MDKIEKHRYFFLPETNSTDFKYSNNKIEKFASDLLNQILDNCETSDLCYISGPATGIENYKERFKDVYDYMEENFGDLGYCFINPMEHIDKFPEEATYVDKVIFTNQLLSKCNYLVLDDRDDNWKNSKGVLSELSFASGDGYITLISFRQLSQGRN